jgi:transposase
VRSSLPASQQLILEAVEETADGIVFRVRGKHTPRCPSCFESRVSYHSRYIRRMRDLPWQGKRVEIHLRARRFRCRNNACDRKIFAERLPDLAGPKARETTRLCEIVGLVGYALGDFPVSDSYIALASFVATIPCYAASNRVGAERASRRCECWE